MNDSRSDSHIQNVEVPQTGANHLPRRVLFRFQRRAGCSGPEKGPAALADCSPPTQYDPRIKLDLMRSGRRLGVRYRRFIGGKLALTGFVEEPRGPADHDTDGTGKIEEYRRFKPVGIPKARLERMARLTASIRFSKTSNRGGGRDRAERPARPCAGGTDVWAGKGDITRV